MPSAYVCVLLRKFFVVASVTRFSELHLAVHGAVGFKAWINETKEASFALLSGAVGSDHSSLASLAQTPSR
jgi:hypothetical protein